MFKTQQADSEIHEDQLLNFLVTQLDEKIALNLANNAKTDAEDVYEVLVGATADGDNSAFDQRFSTVIDDSPQLNRWLGSR